jgi:hypothetical protein
MTKADRTQERKLSRRRPQIEGKKERKPELPPGALDLLEQDNREVEEWFDEHD